MNKYNLAKFILLTAILLVIRTPGSLAQIENWEIIKSESGAFEARFPKDSITKTQTLRVDETILLYNTETSVTTEEKSGIKTYMIKLEQTMGHPLTQNMIGFALASDVAKYTKLAQSLGGELVTNEDLNYGDFRGKDLYISYKNDQGHRGIRVRILFTDVSRIYMVTNGDASASYSYRANTFYENIKLFDKPGFKEGKFGEGWQELTSSRNIFTIIAPPEGNPYWSNDVITKSTSSGESLGYYFLDPILKFKTYYNVSAYILDNKVTTHLVKSVLAGEHLSKYVDDASPEMIPLQEIKLDDRKLMTARINIVPKPSASYLNMVILEAHFKDNILVVQELAGADDHTLSPLGLNLLSGMKFHPPEKKKGTEKKAEIPKTEPAATTP